MDKLSVETVFIKEKVKQGEEEEWGKWKEKKH